MIEAVTMEMDMDSTLSLFLSLAAVDWKLGWKVFGG